MLHELSEPQIKREMKAIRFNLRHKAKDKETIETLKCALRMYEAKLKKTEKVVFS